MSRIGRIQKQTDNRFLNLYELEAIHRDGSASPYYVASRAKEISDLKAVSHRKTRETAFFVSKGKAPSPSLS